MTGETVSRDGWWALNVCIPEEPAETDGSLSIQIHPRQSMEIRAITCRRLHLRAERAVTPPAEHRPPQWVVLEQHSCRRPHKAHRYATHPAVHLSQAFPSYRSAATHTPSIPSPAGSGVNRHGSQTTWNSQSSSKNRLTDYSCFQNRSKPGIIVFWCSIQWAHKPQILFNLKV